MTEQEVLSKQSDALEYHLEVDAGGAWTMDETSDGGTNPHPGAD